MPLLSSTGFCLASPGKLYLVFAPLQSGKYRRYLAKWFPSLAAPTIELNLERTSASFDSRWIDIEHGLVFEMPPVGGGKKVSLRAPFAADAVLSLTASRYSAERDLP
jgi:hypothetical protein